MSKVTNKYGELKVVPNTEALEGKQSTQHVSIKELLELLLLEQRITNAHLQSMTEEEIGEYDVD